MFSLFGNQKINAFGLDVSDVSIKVMQLEKVKSSLNLRAYSNYPLSGKLFNNHMIISEQRLADSINRAIEEARNVNTKYVVASVPEMKSFVRVIYIPRMPESEIVNALPWELEQNIPVPIDQVYLDWQIIKEVDDRLELLVTAAPKDYVDSLAETLELAKLKPVAFELESQATARAVVGSEDADRAILILDMATLQTSFIVVNNSALEYTSSIPVAGRAFTESIARNLGVPASEAEKIKQELGLVEESKRGNIKRAILPMLDNIVDEIRNVVRFHEEHANPKSRIDKIYLSGGSAKLMGIADYISARLNLGADRPLGKVVLGNPWINVIQTTDHQLPFSKEEALEYSTVAGLAIRGVNYETD
ncbi:MAG: type IV pilus assembly protein PilM [Candidatus Doudnabacteria bacterium]|nr:type IV pilus assembly protein PilM [Candidatus Doudnabacteria bacterium]